MTLIRCLGLLPGTGTDHQPVQDKISEHSYSWLWIPIHLHREIPGIKAR